MTPRPIAVALGDIHLDQRIWSKIHGVTGDAEIGYMSFLKVAQKYNVPAVIVGDLFDVAKPTPDVVRMHRRGMDYCSKHGIPVYDLQGNHDRQEVPWSVALHDHSTYVGNGTPFELGGHMATAFDYAPIDDIEHKIRSADTPLLFLHQAVRQALGFENAWNADLDWIPDAVKLTVIGDIHKPMDFEMSSGRRALYTGPGHARDIDQVGPKSVVVIYDDLTYTREPIPSRHIRKFQVLTTSDVDAVEAWVTSSLAVEGLLPFAWVEHVAEVSASCASLQRKLVEAKQAIIYREPLIVSDETLLGSKADENDDNITPLHMLSRIVSPDKDPELFGFVSELLDDRVAITDIVTKRRGA